MYIVNRYILAFPGNPGKLPSLKINKYLDGARPTLFSSAASSTLGYHIFPNGYTVRIQIMLMMNAKVSW
jgi:hypothetical protein